MRYITESRYKGPKHVRIWTRFVTGSIAIGPIWLNIGGRKPLAHLPVWRRHLLHLPSIRWRIL